MHSPSVHGCAYDHVLRQTYKISPSVLPETTQRGEAEKVRVALSKSKIVAYVVTPLRIRA